MADLFFADLVREASWGTGAGDLALGGAVAGHRRFADAVPPGARFHYCIAGVTHSGEWEVGEGELGSGGTLLRTPIVSSAGEGEAVSFAAGLKSVALTVAAEWFSNAGGGGASEMEDIEGLEEALAAKAAAVHGHAAGEIEGLTAALAGKADAAHGHAPGEIAGLQAVLAGKAAVAHGHALGEVAGLQDALAGKAPVAHGHALGEVAGLPDALAGKAPVTHGHALGEVAGLQGALDAKAAVSHGHAQGDVSGLQEALAGKAPLSHGHALGDVAGLQGALDGKAAVSHAHSFASLSGRPTTLAGYGITDAQPFDADLGAIAAIETAAFGRSLLALADASALRGAAQADAHYLRPRSLGVSLLARYPLASRFYPATGCTFGTASGVAVTSASLIYAQAFDIRIALTHFSFEVTVAGGAGAKVRLGLYDCLESGLPGALLQDLGETAVDSAGVKHAPLPQAFAVDRPVWFAFVSNDLAWQTRWFDILASENQRGFGVSALSGGGTVAGLRGNHSYGPLPAAFPAIASTYSQCRTIAGRGSG
ncbi:MAG TPA: hypothetical protein VEZ20_13010 [Allosphingosinicella sp.]|nr:hypothetical protein [Allosphingosinicella sp.]